MNRAQRRALQKRGFMSLVPTATIDLDRERTMRLDLNALSDYERVTGKSIMSGGFALEKMGVPDIRALLWACLVQEDESLTERQVGAMLHVGNLTEVTRAITALVRGAMPEEEASGAESPLPAPKGKASTG